MPAFKSDILLVGGGQALAVCRFKHDLPTVARRTLCLNRVIEIGIACDAIGVMSEFDNWLRQV